MQDYFLKIHSFWLAFSHNNLWEDTIRGHSQQLYDEWGRKWDVTLVIYTHGPKGDIQCTVYTVYIYTVYHTLLVPKVHPNLHRNHIDKYLKSNFLKVTKVEPNQHRIHSGALFAYCRFRILKLRSRNNKLSCGTEWKWSSGQIYI